MIPVLAIDPGGRNTGIVLRHRDDLLGWELVTRQGSERIPRDGTYMREVVDAARGILGRNGFDPADGGYVVAVEEVAWWPANTRKGPPRDERGLYATAYVVGAILLRWPDAIVVDSGRGVANLHPLAYPAEIRAPGSGSDRLVHVRAAWDHSHAGETTYLTRAREARQ